MTTKNAESNVDNLTVGAVATADLPVNQGDVSMLGNLVAKGNGSFTGLVTATGGVSIPAEATTGGSISPSAAKGLYLAVPLSAAQIIAMGTTPITVIAAPGAGKTIVLERAMLRVTRTATQFTSGGTVILQYHTGTVAAINTIAAANITGAAGVIDASRSGIDAANTENDPLEITNGTAAFATGTGTAVLHLWYQIV